MSANEYAYFAPGTRVVATIGPVPLTGVVSGPMNESGLYPVTLDRSSYRFAAYAPRDLREA